MTTQEKYKRLLDLIRGFGGLAVASSGGVDSSFLLKCAQDSLGGHVLAIIVDSVFVPRDEIRGAIGFCESIGARHAVLHADVLSAPLVQSNPRDRCYHCKRILFEKMLGEAASAGFPILADGSNADDEGDYRPGMRALHELGVRSPLKEVGLTKVEIRILSREMGLPCWDKPSAACLASRIAYGESLTPEKLRAVEEGERLLHRMGIRQCRVRVRGSSARIELEPKDFETLMIVENRRSICQALKNSGFTYISLDLEGFRSGSMNEEKTTV